MEARAETQSRNLKAGTAAETLEGCSFLDHPLHHTYLAFMISQAHLPRNGASHIKLGPSTSIVNHIRLSEVWPQASLIDAILIWRVPLLVDNDS